MNLKLLVFILLFSNIIFAQKKILVIDKENKKPILNVAILINDTVKYISNEEGIIFIKDKDINKEVKVKHLIFEKIELENFINIDTIFLKDKIESLNEIILTKTNEKKIVKTVFPPNSILSEFGFYKGWSTKLESEYATFLTNEDKKIAKIKSIIIELKKGHWVNKKNLMMPFKVNLYSIDSISKLPCKRLLNKSIIIQKEKNNNLEIDISEYDIDFPISGIFVSIETLSAEFYVKKGFKYNVGPSFKYLRIINHKKNYTLRKENNKEEWELIKTFIYNFGIKIIK
ncbi:hypothetical protein [uncultured Flavobacterium sp.]|uniref:hypothetical protein n=1 Tax=uncultured Flavobacterium sp. TaxID=165435 RepID=UPI0030EC06B7|tara:strand:- start:1570 stop:2427 length:858 start_codon:yes stop_codon:yes gene_type:complete